jgi:hypothetical protein
MVWGPEATSGPFIFGPSLGAKMFGNGVSRATSLAFLGGWPRIVQWGAPSIDADQKKGEKRESLGIQ